MGPGSGHWDLEKAHGTDRVKIVTKNCNGIVMPTEILDSGMPWNTFGGARWPSLNALESVPDERAAVPWRNMTPTFEHYIPLASDVWLSSCGTNACFVGAHWKHKAPHTTNTPGPQTPWCWSWPQNDGHECQVNMTSRKPAVIENLQSTRSSPLNVHAIEVWG